MVETQTDILQQVNSPGPLVERFFRIAESRPEHTAVVAPDATLTYAQLAAAVTATAKRLHDAGSGLEEPVGVAAVRGAAFVVGSLAAMTAGAAYVPLEPTMPWRRIEMLVATADIGIVISPATDAPVFTRTGARTIPPLIEEQETAIAASVQSTAPDALAYQMFTSGSSGVPKLVAVEQRSVCALVDGFDEVAPAAGAIVSTSLCRFSFDVSVWEVYAALLTGGTVHVLDVGAHDAAGLVGELVGRGITTAYVPPHAIELVTALLRGRSDVLLERVLLGVEPIPQRTVQSLIDAVPGLTAVNGYGPTECTVCSTFHVFSGVEEPERRTPIGVAVPGWKVDVVDGSMGPVPVGVVGEIVVGGAGLARGYVGDAALTDERFVAGGDGRRWYRTGDLGRWLPSGVLEFVGRADDQVKIRGFRVELGEVEAALAECPGVSRAVACAPEAAGGRRLLGFVVGDVEGASVRSWVGSRLPEYAVPSRVAVVAEIPLTANGKVDRAALVAGSAEGGSAEGGSGGGDPMGAVESALAELWATVLELPSVGVHDNFFDLGGDSRLLAVLAQRVRERFLPSLRVVDLLTYPTVRDLARYLDEHGDAQEGLDAVAARAATRRTRRAR